VHVHAQECSALEKDQIWFLDVESAPWIHVGHYDATGLFLSYLDNPGVSGLINMCDMDKLVESPLTGGGGDYWYDSKVYYSSEDRYVQASDPGIFVSYASLLADSSMLYVYDTMPVPEYGDPLFFDAGACCLPGNPSSEVVLSLQRSVPTPIGYGSEVRVQLDSCNWIRMSC